MLELFLPLCKGHNINKFSNNGRQDNTQLTCTDRQSLERLLLHNETAANEHTGGRGETQPNVEVSCLTHCLCLKVQNNTVKYATRINADVPSPYKAICAKFMLVMRLYKVSILPFLYLIFLNLVFSGQMFICNLQASYNPLSIHSARPTSAILTSQGCFKCLPCKLGLADPL